MRMRYPFLFKLTILFVFFLPLISVQLPSVSFGFSINFARMFIVLASLVLFINIAIDIKFFNALRKGKYNNPYVILLFFYSIFSILYYYLLLYLGQTELFGSGDFFTRNWQGRPLVQLLTFFTYGIIPFYLIKKYAQQDYCRKIIERTIVFATLLVVYYGFIQQIFLRLGLPITGLTLYDRVVATAKVGGVGMLRFYSLVGEPRHLGAFLVGAFFFYLYSHYGKKLFFTKVNVVLIIIAFFLTLSTSAYLAAIFSLLVIFLDAVFYKRIKINFRYVKYGIGILLVIIIVFNTFLISIIADRPMRYYRAISSKLQGQTESSFLLTAQSLDFVIIPYLAQITKEPLLHILIGHGYGNFLTGVADILKNYFHWDIIQEDKKFGDTTSYLIKIFIEGGIVGTFIYLMIFLYTLKLNNKLIYFYKKISDKDEYYKALLLRLAFIAFFVSNAIEISFYYFIMMGLIVGKLNGVVESVDKKSDTPRRLISGVILK